MTVRSFVTRVVFGLVVISLGSQAFAARTTTYYHNDGLGSVVAATNDAGQVLWRKDYAPFGEQIDTSPDTERQSYTGKSHDDVTGLTYFGGRYYDPQIARFMSVANAVAGFAAKASKRGGEDSAAAAGRKAHEEFKEKVKAKRGWKSEPQDLVDPQTVKKVCRML
jgi:RHS repeat-associated protein